MNPAPRIAICIAWSLALGCGAVSPPDADPIAPPVAAPAPATVPDPAEELISPERPSAAPDAAPAEPVTASDEPDAGPAAAPTEPMASPDPKLIDALDAAEAKASPEGRLVLATGRRMALVDRVVILGACWDYANTIYKRAGFPANKRRTVFNKPKTGPYADPKLFAPGDFLSYSHDVKGAWVHSAIFVDWTNAGGRVALMLSYVGGRKAIPALYARNDLSRVFRVVRPKP